MQKHNKEIGIACCYFNPMHRKSRLANYTRFRAHIEKSGVFLLTVELAIGDERYELDRFSDILKVRSKSVLFHKERLLNIGIEELLNKGYEKIVWLDADIEFEDGDWLKNISKKLEIHPICQVFSYVFVKTKKECPGAYHIGAVKELEEIRDISKSASKYGFGWATTREFLRTTRLFEYAIVGGGDALFFLGCFFHGRDIDRINNHPDFLAIKHDDYKKVYISWAIECAKAAKGNVGYVNQTILTFYHGELKNRRYSVRQEILKSNSYVPQKDLTFNKDGCLEIKVQKGKLAQDILEYFAQRDGE